MVLGRILRIVSVLRSGSEAVQAGGGISEASKSGVIERLYLSPEGATGQSAIRSARKWPRALLALAIC